MNVGGKGFGDLQESELLELTVSDEPLSVCEIEEILENQPDEEMVEDGKEVLTISEKSVADILMFVQKVIDEAMNMNHDKESTI